MSKRKSDKETKCQRDIVSNRQRHRKIGRDRKRESIIIIGFIDFVFPRFSPHFWQVITFRIEFKEGEKNEKNEARKSGGQE